MLKRINPLSCYYALRATKILEKNMNGNMINRLEVLVKKAYYVYKRYEIPSTFALIYHDRPLSVIELSKYVRQSDQFIPLDENHYFMIFHFTNQANAYKASQNIIYRLDKHFNNDEVSFIALDSFDVNKSPHSVLSRLKQILAQTRKESYSRVETEDILER